MDVEVSIRDLPITQWVTVLLGWTTRALYFGPIVSQRRMLFFPCLALLFDQRLLTQVRRTTAFYVSLCYGSFLVLYAYVVCILMALYPRPFNFFYLEPIVRHEVILDASAEEPGNGGEACELDHGKRDRFSQVPNHGKGVDTLRPALTHAG